MMDSWTALRDGVDIDATSLDYAYTWTDSTSPLPVAGLICGERQTLVDMKTHESFRCFWAAVITPSGACFATSRPSLVNQICELIADLGNIDEWPTFSLKLSTEYLDGVRLTSIDMSL